MFEGLLSQVQEKYPREEIETALKIYIESWGENDLEGRKKLFSPDIIFTDPAHGPQLKGIDELYGMWQGLTKGPFQTEAQLHRRVIVGRSAILDFTMHLKGADPQTLHVVDHFLFDEKGKIIKLTAYWDENCVNEGK